MVTRILLLAVGATCAAGAPTAQVDVNWNFVRWVGGVADFGRDRHIGVHSVNTDNDWTGSEDKMDELMNGLDVYFGRDNGIAPFNFEMTPNSSVVPNTFNVSSLAANGAQYRKAYANQTNRLPYEKRMGNMILGTQLHPLYPTLDWNPNGFTFGHWQPKTVNTSAAWVAQFLRDFFRNTSQTPADGPMRPMYWEVVNEPDMELMTGEFVVSNWESLWEYHNLVAEEVRAALGPLAPKIGGFTFGLHDLNEQDLPRHDPDYLRQWIPNKTIADMYEKAAETAYPRTGQPWEQWDKIWQGFFDHCPNMDFFSIHLYDWPHWNLGTNQGHIRTGGHVEAVLEITEWYDVRKDGKRTPVVVSEYGSTANVYEKQLGLDHKRVDWENLRPFSAMLMQFLARPDYIVQTLPFAPIKATWGNYVDPDGKMHRYQTTMLNNATGSWEWTDFILFYRLWSDVDGTRIEARSSNLNLQVDAYVSPGNTSASLILNNLDVNATTVSIANFGLDLSRVTAVQIKHLFLDMTLGTDGQPSLTVTNTTAVPASVTVAPQATAIVHLTFASPLSLNASSQETKYYGAKLSSTTPSNLNVNGPPAPPAPPSPYPPPFRVSGSTVVAHIDNVKVPSTPGATAALRISGQFWWNFLTNDRNTVSINNHTLVFPTEFMGPDPLVPRWLGVLVIPVPVEYLVQGLNVAHCNVENNNYFTTATLQVWEYSSAPGRSPPIAALNQPI